MEQLRQDIKNVEKKIDDHFFEFNKTFKNHELMEEELLLANTKRLDKMDDMFVKLKNHYHGKYEKMSKRITGVYIALLIAYIAITILGYIHF